MESTVSALDDVGLLSSLVDESLGVCVGFFRKRHQPRVISASLFEGNQDLEVVGESFHAENLSILVSELAEPVHFRKGRLRLPIHAILQADIDNQYDPNAVSVWIGGRKVGHLSRDNAAAYRPGLIELQSQEGRPVALAGDLVGSDGHYGVFLRHNPEDFGVASSYRSASRPESGTQLRTGFSEAVNTDKADDSYDLEWTDTLPMDTARRIPRLRTLLKEDPDPIDRHFMLAQLERDLYACRDVWPAALDEYDEVAEQHHAEMEGGMRAALYQKFGAIPVLETYKQASIRASKAKDWDRALLWAERGISIYGDNAARHEAVEDLHKRAQKARAKLGGTA